MLTHSMPALNPVNRCSRVIWGVAVAVSSRRRREACSALFSTFHSDTSPSLPPKASRTSRSQLQSQYITTSKCCSNGTVFSGLTEPALALTQFTYTLSSRLP